MSRGRPAILLLNAGSSSLKFALHSERETLSGQIAGIGAGTSFSFGSERVALADTGDHATALGVIFDHLGERLKAVAAIGHRIVHGGGKYTAPVVVDERVLADLDSLKRLAPLHMPPGLDVLNGARHYASGLINIACFDTAFHGTQPDIATRLPLPDTYHQRGYRRYGFHGLSYEHVVEALPKLTGKPLPRRLIAAHLGHGSSLCAILAGKSIATTMGFSTADGLIMGTRTGAIDPGVLLALLREGRDADKMEQLLYRESGLLALSGISANMKVLMASDTAAARRAIEHYCYSASRHAGSLAVALGGVDAIVFTGGIGENARPIRDRIVAQLSSIFPNLAAFVVNADEEQVMAGHVREVLLALGTRGEFGH